MTMSDPLGDMLTRIRNGQMAAKAVIECPFSKLRENVCKVLDIEANHLWVLLHRARKQLRQLLEKHWDNSDKKIKF